MLHQEPSQPFSEPVEGIKEPIVTPTQPRFMLAYDEDREVDPDA